MSQQALQIKLATDGLEELVKLDNAGEVLEFEYSLFKKINYA